MDGSRRLTSWLRLASALVLALGLSSAAATAGGGDRAPGRESLAAAHLSVVAASIPTAALHTGTVIRHAAHKHQLPVMASGLAATALALTIVASMAVRRHRTDPVLRHHAFSDGARAPPLSAIS